MRKEEPAPALAGEVAVPAEIDRNAIDALRRAKPELAARMLTKFLEHTPQAVSAISDAIAGANAAALALAAHSLKSSSANVGAKRMASLARRLEDLGKAGSIESAESLRTDLEAEFDAVRTTFEQDLRRQKK